MKKNISLSEFASLPDEFKEEIDGNKILKLGPRGQRPLVEGHDFCLIDKGARCSHIARCNECGNMSIIDSKGMCRNCYARSHRVSVLGDRHRENYIKSKERRAEKKALDDVKNLYPENLIFFIFNGRKIQTAEEFKKASQSDIEHIRKSLSTVLNEKEQAIIKLRFEDNFTGVEIGRKLGISRVRVCAITKDAVSKLRKSYLQLTYLSKKYPTSKVGDELRLGQPAILRNH